MQNQNKFLNSSLVFTLSLFFIFLFFFLFLIPFGSSVNWVDQSVTVNSFQGNMTNLSELQDVSITSIQDNQILTYDSGSLSWINEFANSILTFTNGWLSFSDNNQISFNETKANNSFVNEDGYGGNLTLSRVAGSTYSNIQDMQNQFHSAGRVDGGNIVDNGDTTFNVTSGSGFIRDSVSSTAEIYAFDWSALNNVAISDGQELYILVDWNNGSPQVVTSNSVGNSYTNFSLGIVTRDGSDLHIALHRMNVGDHASLMVRRMWETNHIQRDSKDGGLILDTSGRFLTVSAGAFWMGLEKFSINAIDTSSSDTFDAYYQNGSGGFTKESTQTIFNNTGYDDGSGSLADLTGNNYGLHYVYMEIDGELVLVYGRNQYPNLAQAEEDSPPATVPLRLEEHGTLIGRIIFQNGASSATSTESVYSTQFSASIVSDHGSLAGLTDDDHTQYLLVDGTRNQTELKVTNNVTIGNSLLVNNNINVLGNYTSNGNVGITASGTNCTITEIKGGIITGAVCS